MHQAQQDIAIAISIITITITIIAIAGIQQQLWREIRHCDLQRWWDSHPWPIL
jgi:hypothetical protein